MNCSGSELVEISLVTVSKPVSAGEVPLTDTPLVVQVPEYHVIVHPVVGISHSHRRNNYVALIGGHKGIKPGASAIYLLGKQFWFLERSIKPSAPVNLF